MKTDIYTPLPQISTLGGEVSLLDPRVEDIRMGDILTSLHHQSRYGGHTTERVSILHHSILVCLLAALDGATSEEQLVALWHDAPEAYLLDIPRPLKRHLGETYAALERKFTAVVGEALRVDLLNPPTRLKVWDTQALALECELYRPKASYADWVGLPEVSRQMRAVARRARALATESGARAAAREMDAALVRPSRLHRPHPRSPTGAAMNAPELETCGKCMGSGYGGHPDSGALCPGCGGTGGVPSLPPEVQALIAAAETRGMERGD